MSLPSRIVRVVRRTAKKHRLLYAIALLMLSMAWLINAGRLPGAVVVAQAQTAAPTVAATAVVNVPVPNVLLVYDATTVALINTSTAPVSLAGVSLMRAGGTVRFTLGIMTAALQPGHCVQVWTSAVRQIIGKPDECATRDRYQALPRKDTYFWVADYDGETFRPQLNGSALTICKASTKDVQRCAFGIPQGDDARQRWAVISPDTGQAMPAGIQLAYDANQLWIGNGTPDTVLPTDTLRLLYTIGSKPVTWSPGNSKWDSSVWDGHTLSVGQCLVLYTDAAKVQPLLPCVPVAQAVLADQPWKGRFDVMGPREERRATCGGNQTPTGPVLCIVGG